MIEKHVCTSYRDGDWIIYSCPHCDYELRENWRDGNLQVRNPKRDVRHSGTYFPEEYKEAFENIN
jgi:hypothetical protein